MSATPPQTQLTPAEQRQHQSEADLQTVSIWLFYAFLFGWAAVIVRNATAFHYAAPGRSALPSTISDIVQAFVWTLACVGMGFASGFLFGIPKSIARAHDDTQQVVGNGATARLRVNTNLEDISDWLTKVLVGATLTQVERIPGAIRRATVFMAGGATGSEISLYAAILIYFTVLGFLAGYILTRLFFSRAFAIADQDTDPGEHMHLERITAEVSRGPQKATPALV